MHVKPTDIYLPRNSYESHKFHIQQSLRLQNRNRRLSVTVIAVQTSRQALVEPPHHTSLNVPSRQLRIAHSHNKAGERYGRPILVRCIQFISGGNLDPIYPKDVVFEAHLTGGSIDQHRGRVWGFGPICLDLDIHAVQAALSDANLTRAGTTRNVLRVLTECSANVPLLEVVRTTTPRKQHQPLADTGSYSKMWSLQDVPSGIGSIRCSTSTPKLRPCFT